MTDQTGGPAFPLADSCCEYGNTNRSDANGMTLRDYFAAKAMQSLILLHHDMELSFAITAEDAYRMANIMLKVRNND